MGPYDIERSEKKCMLKQKQKQNKKLLLYNLLFVKVLVRCVQRATLALIKLFTCVRISDNATVRHGEKLLMLKTFTSVLNKDFLIIFCYLINST